MNLKVQDGNGVLADAAIPAMVRRVIELCEGLPKGDGLTMREVSERLGVAPNTIQQHSVDSRLDPYTIRGYKLSRGRTGNVYANPKTVEAYHADQSDS